MEEKSKITGEKKKRSSFKPGYCQLPKWLRGVLAFLLALVVFLTGIKVGQKGQTIYRLIHREPPSQTIDFSLFWQVWDKIHTSFLHSVDDKKLFYGAIKGLVSGTGDPYSAFLTPSETRIFSEDMEEEFYGVGIEISAKQGKIVVVSCLENSPAKKAGLKPNDEIVAVDGKPTSGRSLMEIVSWIRGKTGTEVVLTVKREEEPELKQFRIKRAKIKVESVKSGWLKGKVFYLKITQFSEKTFPLFYQKVMQAKLKKPKGIIIDLRSNPGGYFQAAVDIASLFLGKKVIVYEKNKSGKLKAYRGNKEAILPRTPAAVLVDKGSASASEILVGALKDYRRAKIIGEKTFGKGVMQTWETLPDGSSLVLTSAYWLTPKKYQIQGRGIRPDIVVGSGKVDCSLEDKVCQKALEILTKR